jgi:hypothetical protein
VSFSFRDLIFNQRKTEKRTPDKLERISKKLNDLVVVKRDCITSINTPKQKGIRHI